MTFLGITLGKRAQLALRIFGYVALGLVAFVFALQMTFPYSRVKDRVQEALSAKYDVIIGGVDRGLMPGKMILTNVSLKTRPTQPNQLPTLFYIKEISIDLGVLALFGKTLSVDVEATIGAGTLSGNIKMEKERVRIDFSSDSLPGASLPFKEGIGLPVIGNVAFDLDFDLRLVRNKVDWTKAAGTLTLQCPTGCTIGDGKSKIRPAVTRPNQQEFVKDGIEFNKLTFDKFLATLEIKKGTAKITKWEVPSKDGEIHLAFEAKLEPLLNDSQVTGCLRFNGSKDLEQRDYRTFMQLRTLGAPLSSADNLFHIRLTGPFRQIKRLAQECGPGAPPPKTPGVRQPDAPTNTAGSSGNPGGATPEIPQPPPAPPPVTPDPNQPGMPNERRTPGEARPATLDGVGTPPAPAAPNLPAPVIPAPPAGQPGNAQPPPPPPQVPSTPNPYESGGNYVPPPGTVPPPAPIEQGGASGGAPGAPMENRPE